MAKLKDAMIEKSESDTGLLADLERNKKSKVENNVFETPEEHIKRIRNELF